MLCVLGSAAKGADFRFRLPLRSRRGAALLKKNSLRFHSAPAVVILRSALRDEESLLSFAGAAHLAFERSVRIRRPQLVRVLPNEKRVSGCRTLSGLCEGCGFSLSCPASASRRTQRLCPALRPPARGHSEERSSRRRISPAFPRNGLMLPTRFGFVSGHDFSRATKGPRGSASFRACLLARSIRLAGNNPVSLCRTEYSPATPSRGSSPLPAQSARPRHRRGCLLRPF